jgi:hypothetical protein
MPSSEARAVTVGRLACEAEAGGHVVICDRQIEPGAEVEAVALAEADSCHRVALEIRLSCNDVDRATDRVLAEQRALRAAEHFDSFDIRQLEGAADRAGNVDAVQIHAHARIGRRDEVDLAHTAQEERRVAAAMRARYVLQTGNLA